MSRTTTRPSGDLRRWAATLTVCLGLFLLGIDMTMLNVAVPDLQADLQPSMAQIQWIVDGYALVLGGTVLTAGALTDRIGRRRAFVIGLALCAGASLLGALARTPEQVIAARGGMGAGAALLMPATLSTIHNLFPEPQLRRRAIAVWTAVLGAGGLTGPVIGGWLVEHFSWRAGFWINLPIIAITVVLAVLVVPESRGSGKPVDVPGALTSAAGLLSLVWAFIEAPTRGWTGTPVLAAFGAAGLLLMAFTARQATARHPMLPLSLLRRPSVMVGAAVLALMSFSLFGALFITTLYLQGVLGYTPWQAGLRTLALPAGLVIGAMGSLPLAARWGNRFPIVAGLIVATAAFTFLATTTANSAYGHLVVFQTVAGVGAGLSAAAATETVMGATPGDRAGLGSAINDATRQIGSALGVAVQGSLLVTIHSHRMADRLAGTDVPASLAQTVIHQGQGLTTIATAPTLPDSLREQLLAAARESFVAGLTGTALLAGAVTLLAAVAATLLLSSQTCQALPTAAPHAPPRGRGAALEAVPLPQMDAK
ncbi:MFS transporter [Streptomyces sp. NBC_00047]|uniref:MFS transporter n=1 Tax=Streptomyces sp. NBC_00047 TaxID=2975627 RepID=UPI0022509D0A|nr:MFS transporter [Streptomyces sp. NBC_00047]MCX5611359.1 MFS transporter [Streptomyces sp. NBC_00047]